MRAVGFGIATFVAGSLVMLAFGAGWPIKLDDSAFIALTTLVPILAGSVAAYHSSWQRILNGTVGGSAGVLLIVVPFVLIPGPPIPVSIFVMSALLYSLLASLGAILGSHLRAKLGT
jgi:hypothetical protein